MKILAVMDIKAKVFMKPFSDRFLAEALRSFEIGVNSKDSMFNRFPDDYALYEIADFDEQTGAVVPHAHPISIGTARHFLKEPVVQ